MSRYKDTTTPAGKPKTPYTGQDNGKVTVSFNIKIGEIITFIILASFSLWLLSVTPAHAENLTKPSNQIGVP